MFFKVHESYRRVVAVCDSGLIGKKFEEGKFQLDVRENFYRGEEISSEGLSEFLKRELAEDSTFNIAGEESVKIALAEGIISEGHVSKIGSVPFALLLV